METPSNTRTPLSARARHRRRPLTPLAYVLWGILAIVVVACASLIHKKWQSGELRHVLVEAWRDGDAPNVPTGVTPYDLQRWAELWRGRRIAWENRPGAGRGYESRDVRLGELRTGDAYRLLRCAASDLSSMEIDVLQGNTRSARRHARSMEKYVREWDGRVAGKGIDWDSLKDTR